jgi:hypothetical protein
MKSSLRIKKLGIEFENFMSDEGLINQVSHIIKANKNSLKSLIIKNIAIDNLKSLGEIKNLRELCLDLVNII